VLLFAPDSAYGTPDALKRLIDEAHGRGLMVFLDVVYNHFGPSGNYLHRYAPGFFTDRFHTPWGQAINYAVPEGRAVRDFMIHNALYGFKSTASTACALMPSMPFGTIASLISWRRLPQRSVSTWTTRGTSIWCSRTTTTRRAI